MNARFQRGGLAMRRANRGFWSDGYVKRHAETEGYHYIPVWRPAQKIESSRQTMSFLCG